MRERVRALDFIDAHALVDEFARQIRQELDYRLEARNAQTFHRNFAGDPHVHVPKVYWTYTRARVLTLEWLDGTQLADVDALPLTLEERRDLAYRIAETWMAMIFRHGFFHGDPHPANILVLEEAGTIGLVDFGAVGKLTDDDMSKLTRLFIDAAQENVDVLPKRLADLGVRYPKEREEEFLAELREMYYRYYGASLSEIDPIQVIREAFQLIYSMNLQLPTRFLLLDRAIATLGSVGVELYPGLQRVRGRAAVRARAAARPLHAATGRAARAPRRDRATRRSSREAPFQWHDFMEQVRDGQIEVGFVHKGLDDFLEQTQRVFNRLVVALDRRRRADRLEPDRRCSRRAARTCSASTSSRWSASRSRPARGVAALGRRPLRTAVDDSSHFRCERTSGARAPAVRSVARMTDSLLAEPEASMRGFLERQLRSDGFDVLAFRADGAAAHRPARRARARRSGCARPHARARLPGDRARRRRPRRGARARALRRLPRAAVRLRGARGAHPRRAAPLPAAQRAARCRDRSSVDRRARRVLVHGRDVALSQKEFALLVKLATDPDRVFTREQLLRDVWGYRRFAPTRTVESHASRMRCKLAAAGAPRLGRQRVGRGLQAAAYAMTGSVSRAVACSRRPVRAITMASTAKTAPTRKATW